jgi:hypothetical protein
VYDNPVWKLYGSSDGIYAPGGVSLYVDGNELTLIHETDVPIGDYYVTATDKGKVESERLQLTVANPQQTPTPIVSNPTVSKTSYAQTSAIFVLDPSTAYPSAIWKVYRTSASVSPANDVFAMNNGTNLLLSSPNILAQEFYVTATEPGKTESERLHLTVNPYVESDRTATPSIFMSTVEKVSPQAMVSFDLLNEYVNPTWKVYLSASGVLTADGISATNNGKTLTLSHGYDIPTGDYYISAKEIDKQESTRQKVTVNNYVQPRTPTPRVTSATVSKSEVIQTSVTFNLTNTYTTTIWKAYAGQNDPGIVSGVQVANRGTNLTLTHSANILPGSYYITATEPGMAESERLKLTVDNTVLPKTATPAVEEATVEKPNSDQTSVTFTLKSAYTNTIWKIYAVDNGTDGAVTAANTGKTLTLKHKTNVPVGDYLITATENGKSESDALKLTVASITHTRTPTADIIIQAKLTDTDKQVIFTLTNKAPYDAATTTWKVYASADGQGLASGVTASNNGHALTLQHASNLLPNSYWISATAVGKVESNRLRLVVAPVVIQQGGGITVYNFDLTSLVAIPIAGAPMQQTFTAQTQYTGTIEWRDAKTNLPASTFSAGNTYKAIVTLTAKTGYTFIGVKQNEFRHTGSETITNASNDGTVTIVFPVLPSGTTITGPFDLTELVPVPAKGETPRRVLILPDGTHYTGTVVWKDADNVTLTGNFVAPTVYKAIVTLTAEAGYSFVGIPPNAFYHTGAMMENGIYEVTTIPNSGVVTIVFPPTGPEPTDNVPFELTSPSTNVTGNTITTGHTTPKTVVVNVVKNTTSVTITAKKTSKQWLNIPETTPGVTVGTSALTVDVSSIATTGGEKTFDLTISETDKASIIYHITVNVVLFPPTTDVTFALTTPSGDGNTITKSSNPETVDTVDVHVKVALGTASVVVTATKLAAQRIAKGGKDAAVVTLGTPGTTATQTVTVDVSSIATTAGAWKEFTLTASEPGKNEIVYKFKVEISTLAPTRAVQFKLTSTTPPNNTNALGNGNGISKNIPVVLASGTTSAVITATRLETQTITLNNSDDYTNVTLTGQNGATGDTIITVNTSSIATGGQMKFTLTVSETGKSAIVYDFTVSVQGAPPPTANVPFELREHPDIEGTGYISTDDQTANAKTVTVNVMNNIGRYESIIIAATLAPGQTLGCINSNVTVNYDGIITVNTQSAGIHSGGGIIEFPLTVSETGKSSIVYTFKVRVSPPLVLANKTFTVTGSTPTAELHFSRKSEKFIQVYEDGWVNTYWNNIPIPRDYISHDVLSALLNPDNSVQAGDQFTFDSNSKIAGITRGSRAGTDMTITGRSDGAPNVNSNFASKVTLTASTNGGFIFKGVSLAVHTEVKLVGAQNFTFYGTTIISNTAGNIGTVVMGPASDDIRVSFATGNRYSISMANSIRRVSIGDDGAAPPDNIDVLANNITIVNGTSSSPVNISISSLVKDNTINLYGISAPFIVKGTNGASSYTSNYSSNTNDGYYNRPVTFSGSTSKYTVVSDGSGGSGGDLNRKITVGATTNNSFTFTPTADGKFIVTRTE